MKNGIGYIVVFLSICCACSLQAQIGLDKVGQSTMNFQLVGLSARASSLGDAVFASSIGSEAIFYNPAGLAEMKQPFDASLFYTSWIADITYYAGAVAYNAGDFGTFGLSAMSVDYGTIYATRLTGASSANQSITYEDLGEMKNVGAYSIGISYARAISDKFSMGGTMRYTGQNLGESMLSGGLHENNAAKLIFDLGVKYNVGYKNFRFGMAFRNFSSQLKREQISEQMPVTFTIGTAIDLMDVINEELSSESDLTLGVDYLHSNNYSERMNFGLEYIFMNMLALRGGYQTNRDLGSWSAGFGFFTTVQNYDLRVDYSYSAEKYFTDVSRISLGFGF